ncbi:uncharacterized protein [Hoplias malabaricus]|uniref:uncharacterized protein n=1 Tax=Hoplias malabaricus TaxID=27720 RepID=UPI0034633950
MYAVVILNTSMEVMVIPKIWLTNGKKETYWPPFKSPTKFTEAVKNQFPPDTLTPGQQWEKIYITYIGEHGSFDEAKKIRETFTGSKPQVKSPSTSGDTPLKRRKLNEEMGLNPPEMFLGTSQSTLTSTFTPPSLKHLQSHSSKTGLKEVMGMLQEINQKVQDNSEMLNELLKRVDRAGQPCSSKILSETFTPKLPLTDLSEVNRIEEDLKDYTIKQHYIQYLSKHGKQGIGHKDMIRRIMESVMRDDVADKFNWQGRNQKTGLSALIIKAAGRQCGIHDAVSEKEIKIWLRKATDRNARKKIKNLRDCELDCGSPAVTSLSDNMIF